MGATWLYTICAVTGLVVISALIWWIKESWPSPSQKKPSSSISSPSDSPYVTTPSQQGSCQPLHHQPPSPRPEIRYPPFQYPTLQVPPSSQPSTYQRAQYPPQATTPLSHNASVTKPVSLQRPSRPAARAPELPVASIVIETHEDPESLRLKAKEEGDRMGEFFKERKEAKASGEQQRATELNQRGEAHRANVVLLDKEASAKTFQENNQNRRHNLVDLHGLHVSEADYFKHVSPIWPSPPAASAPELPVTPVVIDPYVSPQRISRPAARAPELPVTAVVIDPHEDPESLRLKADEEGDRMRECFKERDETQASGEQQRAKELDQRGEAHRANMKLLNKEASAKIFQEKNQNRVPSSVDLHGLHVPEALAYFDEAVQGARDHGEPTLCVIVGRGNHCEDNIPKLKPAVHTHGESLGLSIKVDPDNDGRLIVSFK